MQNLVNVPRDFPIFWTRRKEAAEMLGALQKASQIISEIREARFSFMLLAAEVYIIVRSEFHAVLRPL